MRTCNSRFGVTTTAFVVSTLSGNSLRIYRDRIVDRNKIDEKTFGSWLDADLDVLIEEGRRQMERQQGRLEFVSSRAGVLLPVGLALALFLLAQSGIVQTSGAAAVILPAGETSSTAVAHPTAWAARSLLLGGLLSLWGSIIMGSIIVGRSIFEQIDATRLTSEPSPIKRALATTYAGAVIRGENTVAARLTHLATGVLYITFGSVLGALGLLLSR